MSTLSTDTAISIPQPRRRLHAWATEPLLHFVILGALLFAADHFFFAHPEDTQTIVVGADVDREAIDLFKARRGQDPNAQELEALRRIWIDNEVLYREGIALRMDRGDPTIRERVIFKALSMVDAGLKPPPRDAGTVRQWFEAHRAQYDKPMRFDFQEAVLYGDDSEGGVRAFADALNRGSPGDAQAALRVFKARPRTNVAETYGEDFAKALESAPRGEWRAYRAAGKWRAMRVDAVAAGQAASFDELAGVVMHDYIDARMAEARTDAVRELGRKYAVRYEAAK